MVCPEISYTQFVAIFMRQMIFWTIGLASEYPKRNWLNTKNPGSEGLVLPLLGDWHGCSNKNVSAVAPSFDGWARIDLVACLVVENSSPRDPKNMWLCQKEYPQNSCQQKTIQFLSYLSLFWLVLSNICYFPFHIWVVILPIDIHWSYFSGG